MSDAESKLPPQQRNWYLKEWMAALKRKQADILRDLGWERGRTSKVYNGKQPYTRDDIIALADWLGIRDHELLMPPEEAMALKRLLETAALIVAETQTPYEAPVQAAPAKRSRGKG